MAIVLDGTTGITNDGGYTGDGVVFADTTPSNTLVTTTGGNVGVGTSSPDYQLQLEKTAASTFVSIVSGTSNTAGILLGDTDSATIGRIEYDNASNFMALYTNSSERARIDSSGNFIVAAGSEYQPGVGNNTVGIAADANGQFFASSASTPALFNRTADGAIVSFLSAGTAEGSITISGTTTSYNGGHLSRWAQTTTPKDDTLVKGTVLSNLDEMNVYINAEGNPVENEQLNKVKVSDVEGDANVAGVFVNWMHDDAHDVDEINMAMTGDMIIRIAAGVTVARGDLLMSAGDGTAKPQGDDIVRAKTIAKVTSTHVTCTYADGSFCVPCVLMAC